VNCAVPRDTAEKWLGKLMEGHKKDSPRECLFAVSRLAAKFGDRAVDIHPELAARAKDWLTQRGAPPDWLAHLDAPSEENAEERSSVFGEALPLGLKLA
jgi:translation initiation factor 2 alpha subunit (eIF-2alpha)